MAGILDALGPAIDVGRSLIRPSQAVDVVAILGPGFVPLWSALRPLEAAVFESADLMEHPVENGTVIADHLVHHPREILMPMVCIGEREYRSTYASLKAAFMAGIKLTITTRTSSYSDMILTDMPHEETPDRFNAISMALRFREAIVVTPQSGGLTEEQTQDPAQASTQAGGTKQTTTPSTAQAAQGSTSYANSGAGAAPQGSTLYQWYSQ